MRMAGRRKDRDAGQKGEGRGLLLVVDKALGQSLSTARPKRSKAIRKSAIGTAFWPDAFCISAEADLGLGSPRTALASIADGR